MCSLLLLLLLLVAAVVLLVLLEFVSVVIAIEDDEVGARSVPPTCADVVVVIELKPSNRSFELQKNPKKLYSLVTHIFG